MEGYRHRSPFSFQRSRSNSTLIASDRVLEVSRFFPHFYPFIFFKAESGIYETNLGIFSVITRILFELEELVDFILFI